MKRGVRCGLALALCLGRGATALGLTAAAVGLAGCSRAEGAPEQVARAELGLFYGGEVQERRRVSMPSDKPRPTIGFRLTMSAPLQRELGVRWEIDMPGPTARRVQNVGEARVPVGQSRFDQVISVPDNGGFGLWNVRVLTGERIVIDRALVLEP